MKKIWTSALVISVCVCALFAQQHEKKIWNDGRIDYVPAGAKITLQPTPAGEKTAQVYYSLDFGGLSEYTDTITLDEEGQHWIFYSASDVLGKTGDAKSYTVIVDATAPELKYAFDGPVCFGDNGEFFFTSGTGIMLQGEDLLSGVDALYARLDGFDYERVDVPDFLYLDGFQDGKYAGDGYLVDNVGNVSELLFAEGYLDNTPPEFEVSVSEDPVDINGVYHIKDGTECSISASDELSGVAAVYMAVDDSDFIVYNTPFRLPLEDGSHVLKVYATDNLGNRSETAEYPFAIDNRAPSAELRIEAE